MRRNCNLKCSRSSKAAPANSDSHSRTPTFKGLRAGSSASSRAKQFCTSRDTKPETLLRREIWRLGGRFRKNFARLTGTPDLAFIGARVAVFCDGDFWHGRFWNRRLTKLSDGHNASYWIAKLSANRTRDKRVNAELKANGWRVLRFWETDLLKEPQLHAARIMEVVRARDSEMSRPKSHSKRKI